ncbi:MAG: hypothetical protein ACYS5V_16685 [Planctomycetota bacterium]
MKRVCALGMACVLAVASAAPAKEVITGDPVGPARSKGVPIGPAGRLRRLNRTLFDLMHRGRYAEARPIAFEVLQLDPASGAGWYNLACVQRPGPNR